ncbi:hypothetical protein HOLleu_26414 [Holothuria leucospilota]|uniref:Reverse transcriptase/retrotransposon-derived protein RNase H-like domain-containing protein n=1 Tax=Holothuria leucospilota TaxID=206669 RepID=A0A9Q1BP49_HOLLE|nr:hypothetical protein HOLleu_26414 [Holothuria leucospilota]
MQKPANKTELKRYLCMVNNLAKFVENLSETTAPLRKLLEKGIQWHWLEDQEESFCKLNGSVTEAPVRKYYDVQKSVPISVDSSSQGIAAVFLQEDRPIAFALKALTESQQQIEKQLAAIVCDY